ncbi:DUF6093 family protein [Streptomyces sp. ME02-6979.5a]|uniref:DUF6093 family protein n=1 Tax=Streptomyces sp. ME02-6979.5a TaxID=462925 RepID=UPI0029B630CD|nr:DUF6093 family protein [Streptomyces sp. ME02-6979.5a]MDX3343507.1 DUF6093 family protein [Streptomyces sp. ME02-6979.5a]
MAGLDQALAGVTRWIGTNLLIDTVRISLPSGGEPVLNPSTGQLEHPEGATLYEGPGAVVPSSGTTERSAVPDASQPWTQQQKLAYFLLTPLTAPAPQENAVVSVVAVHDPSRTALLGRTWTCAGPGMASTVEVVRKTPLDQNTIPAGVDGGGP